jgi:hypothetical protein
MNNRICVLAIFILSLTMCKKGDPIQTAESNTKIIVGDDSGVQTWALDTVLMGGYQDERSIALDMDGDNLSDFSFTSEIWGSPGVGGHPQSMILSLHENALICGLLKTDSFIIHHGFNTTVGPDNTTNIYHSITFTCRRLAPEDSIQKVVPGQFKLLPMHKGQYLAASDVFGVDTCILNNEAYGYFIGSSVQNDTTIYNYLSNDYTCDQFPANQIRYVGVKLRSPQGDKLGWIKLSITDKYVISLMEYGIQK